MSILRDQNTAFEYIPMERSELYLESNIKFTLNNKNFINPKIFRSDDDDGYIRVYEDVDRDILEFFKKILKEDKPDWWECVDDIIEIAAYPNEFFPFMTRRREISSVAEDLQTQSSRRHPCAVPGYFTIIIFIRSYQFYKKDGYRPSGISLHLYVERDELERFVKEVEKEISKI